MPPLPQEAVPAYTRLSLRLKSRGLWQTHYRFAGELCARLVAGYARMAAAGVSPLALEAHRQACRAELVTMLWLPAERQHIAALTAEGYDAEILKLAAPLREWAV